MINRKLLAGTGASALALTLAACADDGGDSAANGAGDATITLGYLPSWPDGLSTAYLIEHFLEEAGYEVEHDPQSEAAVLYTAVANGDIDMYPSAWPEMTHDHYMEEHGDNIEDLGAYYDNAQLTLAVPEYVEGVDKIEDLKGQGERFGGRIVGIEPSAGLTDQTENSAMPAYDLDDEYQLATSSTPAMLAELDAAIQDEEDIVVTLWRPHFANHVFPVRDLEDPDKVMGEAEALHWLARSGFSEEFPELADWFAELSMTDEEYGALEDLVVNEFEGEEDKAIAAWLEQYPDVIPAAPQRS
ncbi:glycine betaine ABC transporter substrate-binding protein [Corynebacterium propinquum]